jgi:hypothetical protein
MIILRKVFLVIFHDIGCPAPYFPETTPDHPSILQTRFGTKRVIGSPVTFHLKDLSHQRLYSCRRSRMNPGLEAGFLRIEVNLN